MKLETIFDYNPTIKELSDLRFDSFSLCLKFGIDIKEKLTPSIYKKLVSQENAYYDLACLFEFRNDPERSTLYWNKIPKDFKNFGTGFDNKNEIK